MSEESRERVCKDCGETWIFTEGFENRLKELFGNDFKEPKYCYDCRQKRKAERARRKDYQ
jgi:hypothetical protein